LRKHERGDIPQVPWQDKLVFSKIEEMETFQEESKLAYLLIELPTFDFPVVFSETPYTVFIDPEMDNPVENKHRRLVRSERHTFFDVDLKPNSKIRDELNVYDFFYSLSIENPEIPTYPPTIIRGKRFGLEVSISLVKRQERADQVPKMCVLDRD
jgi:hypothetical protein